jgi:O-antigen/teichoic acid export membrane protein
MSHPEVAAARSVVSAPLCEKETLAGAPVIPAERSVAGANSRAGNAPTAAPPRHIGAKSIKRGLVFNLLSALLPTVVALFCMRPIVGGLGHARFGVLSLAWTFVSAIGILDLGIGRALTRFLAVHEERDPEREASVVWTSLGVIFLLGCLGSSIAWGLADVLGARLAHGDAAIRSETVSVLRILSLSVPSVVLSSGLRGILEAFGRFDLTTRVSLPISVLNLLLPVVLIRLDASLPAIVWALVVLRLAGTLLFARISISLVPAMRSLRFSARGIRSVLTFSGWVTVSNIPGPLFAQAERFILGSFTAIVAVGYYSTPAELLSRVTILPAALLQVLFPVLAQAVGSDRRRAARLANRSLLFIAATVVPALTLLVAVAPEGLQLWLGPEFSSHGTWAGRILALATFVNCMAWLPFSLVQSAGRADLIGKLHLVEIPVHLALTALLIAKAGIEGAAVANLLRATVDATVIAWMAGGVLGRDARVTRRYLVLVSMGSVMMLGAALPIALTLRLLWSGVAMVIAGSAAWRLLLDPVDREIVLGEIGAVWARVRSFPA